MKSPLIIAHRGDSKNAPENTLAAFELAINKNADAIEFDLHQSRDGKLVVHHDYTLERTTTGQGSISDHSLSDLRQLDAGSWFSSSFSGEKIPTLSEVLEIGKGKIRFEIELRCPTLPFLKSVIQEIDRHQVANDVEITSPHLPLLPYARMLHKHISVGLFVSPFPEWKSQELGIQHLIQWMSLLDVRTAHLPMGMLTQTLVDELHEKSLKVHGANLNEPEHIEKALNLGIDQLSTDELILALELRRKKPC